MQSLSAILLNRLLSQKTANESKIQLGFKAKDCGTKNRNTHFKLETNILAASFEDFTVANGLRKKCNLKEAHYHCGLCPASTSFSFQSKFLGHMQLTHLHGKRIVRTANNTLQT